MEERVDIHVGGYHLTEPIGTGGMGSVFKATVAADGKVAAKGTTVAQNQISYQSVNVCVFDRECVA